jgi:predicted DNA-binding transcriptional regulator YafY
MRMLQIVPRQPASLDTTSIVERLRDEGFEVTARSVQRDLDKLSGYFALFCDDEHKPYRWSWMESAELLDIPGLNPQTALTLELAAEFLGPLLPRSSLRYLDPHIARARAVLGDLARSRIAAWPKKIRVLHRGMPVAPPKVRPEVLDVVYTALLEDRCFRARYRSRTHGKTKEYDVNPLALVFRPPTVYLLCTARDHQDVVQLVLHRMKRAELIDKPRTVPKGFDVDRYIAKGGFGFQVSPAYVDLVALFSAEAAVPLVEMPIHPKQTLTELDDGRIRLEAIVPDTVELRTWLKGFGEHVEVLEPASLRRELRDLARQLAAIYERPSRKLGRRLAKAKEGPGSSRPVSTGPKKATERPGASARYRDRRSSPR